MTPLLLYLYWDGILSGWIIEQQPFRHYKTIIMTWWLPARVGMVLRPRLQGNETCKQACCVRCRVVIPVLVYKIFWMTANFDSDRAFERLLSSTSKITVEFMECWCAVLDEQDRQHHCGEYNSYALGRVSRRCTDGATKRAHTIGMVTAH